MVGGATSSPRPTAKGVSSRHARAPRGCFPILRRRMQWSYWSDHPWTQRGTRAHAHDSNTRSHAHVHVPTHDSCVHVKAHNVKNKVQTRQGTRNGRAGQQLAPASLGGAVETSLRATSPKEGDNSIAPGLNHVQSTDRWPQSQTAQPTSYLLKSLAPQCLVGKNQYT